MQSTPPLTDFGYAGMVHHPESGLSLATYRAYDPAVGRWLSRDPIGELGGINLYEYVGGNPVISRDPLGLMCPTPGNWPCALFVILCPPPNEGDEGDKGNNKPNDQELINCIILFGIATGGAIPPNNNWPYHPQQPCSYYNHALERMNTRGISPSDVQNVIEKLVSVVQLSNENNFYTGSNGIGVAVNSATSEIVTVIAPK